MKMMCTENTNAGNLVDLDLTFPEQEEIDSGKFPYFCLDVLDLLSAEENGVLPDDSAFVFTVDPVQLFMADVQSLEGAEIVAEWLEHFAEQVRIQARKKFSV